MKYHYCIEHESHVLNGKIEQDEILNAIKSLKIGKSTASDLISNEMLKYGADAILKTLVKLFNFLFDLGTFPKLWNENLLVSLHKKGSKIDPNNYRGISVSSNLGKVFNRIINARLLSFTNDNNLISKFQIGFREKCRTSDHIFSLKSITDVYKKEKKRKHSLLL